MKKVAGRGGNFFDLKEVANFRMETRIRAKQGNFKREPGVADGLFLRPKKGTVGKWG